MNSNHSDLPIVFVRTINVLQIMAILGLGLYFFNHSIAKTLMHASAILGVIVLITAQFRFKSYIPSATLVWPIILLFYAISLWVSYFIHGGSVDYKRANEASEIALVGIIIYFLFCSLTAEKGFLLLFWFISLCAACLAIYIIFLGVAANGHRITLETGMINIFAASFILYLSMSLTLVISRPNPMESGIQLLISILLCIAIVYTGSRGAWISVIAMIACSAWVALKQADSKSRNIPKVIVIILGISIFIGSLYILNSNVKNRIDMAAADVQHLIEGNSRTSLGYRIEMWKSAIQEGGQRAIQGLGSEKLDARLGEAFSDYQLMPESPHVHNDLLEAFMTRGIPGMFMVALLLFGPLVIFCRSKNRYMSTAGILLLISVFVSGLFESLLVMKFFLLFYIVFQSILIGSISSKEPRGGVI